MDMKKIPPPPDWIALQFKSQNEQRGALDKYSKHVASLEITIPCPEHGTGHIRFGCRHVLQIEPAHHPGMVLTPGQYTVCRDCWNLMEQHRFKYPTEIGTICKECIEIVRTTLFLINPEKVLDLRPKNK